MKSYTYEVYHAPKMRVRVVLNDIPLYRCDEIRETNVVRVNACAHLLVPGVNTVIYEVLEASDVGNGSFEINWQYDHDAPVYRYYLGPKDGENYRCPPRPFVNVGASELPDHPYSPSYPSARPQDFDVRGTPALHAAVAAFHAAMSRGDTDAVVSMMGPKFSDLERAYGGNPEMSADAGRREFAGQFSRGVTTTPLEPDRLVFQSCVDGRVAYVTRDDGQPPFEITSASGDRWRQDLVLTPADGTWKILR